MVRILNSPEGIKQKSIDLATLLIPILFFIYFTSRYFGFVLDDAYITLRYSEHLAAGKGILWNTGTTQGIWMDPVEGYTSTLWVLIGAIPHWLGVNPVSFIKFLSILTVVCVMVLLFYIGKRENVKNYFLAPILATIGFSPAAALITVQGMETAVAMLFVCLASVSSLLLLKTHRDRWMISICMSLLLGMLTRPGLVIFSAGMLVTLFTILYIDQKKRHALRLTIYAFLILFIPGVIFLISRKMYFGYWLPNSFYIKESSGLVTIAGGKFVFEFLTIFLGPISFVALFIAMLKPDREVRTEIITILPIIVGAALFMFIWFFISPIQGYLWRFQMPVLPALLLSIIYLCREYDISSVQISVSPTPVLLLILVLGMSLYPLHTFNQAEQNVELRDQTDRVIVGQNLNNLNSDYRMFVTESGAVPYYSNWIAVDKLGLNSEYIAHNGLSQEFLQEYNPDLVMLLVSDRPGMIQARSSETAKYLNSSNYRLVAAVDKTGAGSRNGYHIYFVDRNSDGYREIACTLLTMEDVSYSDRGYFINASTINITESGVTRQGCSG